MINEIPTDRCFTSLVQWCGNVAVCVCHTVDQALPLTKAQCWLCNSVVLTSIIEQFATNQPDPTRRTVEVCCTVERVLPETQTVYEKSAYRKPKANFLGEELCKSLPNSRVQNWPDPHQVPALGACFIGAC